MSTAIQTAEPRAMTVAGLLSSNGFRNKVAAALPKHLSAERYMRIVNNTILRTPKLAQCDANSFANALLLLSQYGLEPDGRRAHLIPFENKKAKRVEVTLIVDWKGLAELVLRSGSIAKLHADLICEADDFEYDCGEVTKHKINFRLPRGERYAVYAMAQTKTGEKFVAVLSRFEVETIRDGSQGWRAFKQGFAKQSPWDPSNPVSEGEMWKKTAFRRLSKWLPLSPELQDAIEMDDDALPPASVVTQQTPNNLVEVVPFEMPAAIEDAPESDDPAESEAGLAPAAEAKAEPAKNGDTPQTELAALVVNAGYTLDQFREWGEGSGALPDASSLTGFRDIKTADAQRLLKAKTGLLQGLAKTK